MPLYAKCAIIGKIDITFVAIYDFLRRFLGPKIVLFFFDKYRVCFMVMIMVMMIIGLVDDDNA